MTWTPRQKLQITGLPFPRTDDSLCPEWIHLVLDLRLVANRTASSKPPFLLDADAATKLFESLRSLPKFRDVGGGDLCFRRFDAVAKAQGSGSPRRIHCWAKNMHSGRSRFHRRPLPCPIAVSETFLLSTGRLPWKCLHTAKVALQISPYPF